MNEKNTIIICYEEQLQELSVVINGKDCRKMPISDSLRQACAGTVPPYQLETKLYEIRTLISKCAEDNYNYDISEPCELEFNGNEKYFPLIRNLFSLPNWKIAQIDSRVKKLHQIYENLLEKSLISELPEEIMFDAEQLATKMCEMLIEFRNLQQKQADNIQKEMCTLRETLSGMKQFEIERKLEDISKRFRTDAERFQRDVNRELQDYSNQGRGEVSISPKDDIFKQLEEEKKKKWQIYGQNFWYQLFVPVRNRLETLTNELNEKFHLSLSWDTFRKELRLFSSKSLFSIFLR